MTLPFISDDPDLKACFWRMKGHREAGFSSCCVLENTGTFHNYLFRRRFLEVRPTSCESSIYPGFLLWCLLG